MLLNSNSLLKFKKFLRMLYTYSLINYQKILVRYISLHPIVWCGIGPVEQRPGGQGCHNPLSTSLCCHHVSSLHYTTLHYNILHYTTLNYTTVGQMVQYLRSIRKLVCWEQRTLLQDPTLQGNNEYCYFFLLRWFI